MAGGTYGNSEIKMMRLVPTLRKSRHEFLYTSGYEAECWDERVYIDYWGRVRLIASNLHSDGCTGVPDFYHDACLRHDVHYRTKKTVISRRPINRKEADRLFYDCIATRSHFGKWTPMGWWRWVGVRVLGWRAWRKKA